MTTRETFINGHKCIEYVGTSIYIIEDIIDETYADKVIKYIEDIELIDTKDEDESHHGRRLLECKYKHLYKTDDEDIPMDYDIYFKMNKIFSIFHKMNDYIRIAGDTFYHLRKIYGPTLLHIDEVRSIESNYLHNQIRCLSVIIALNDDFDGGEFHFPHQNVTHKMKKHSVILFPPFWTHPHEIYALGEGQFRYTITTWGTENIIPESHFRN